MDDKSDWFWRTFQLLQPDCSNEIFGTGLPTSVPQRTFSKFYTNSLKTSDDVIICPDENSQEELSMENRDNGGQWKKIATKIMEKPCRWLKLVSSSTRQADGIRAGERQENLGVVTETPSRRAGNNNRIPERGNNRHATLQHSSH